MWNQKGDDNGRWTEYVNDQTGESSLKEHKLKTVWKSCTKNKHFYELTGNRELTCRECGHTRQFILGLQKLVDGKVVE